MQVPLISSPKVGEYIPGQKAVQYLGSICITVINGHAKNPVGDSTVFSASSEWCHLSANQYITSVQNK